MRRTAPLFILLLFCGFLKIESKAAVIIDDNLGVVNCAPHIAMLEDPSGTLTIDEVAEGTKDRAFQPSLGGVLSLTYSESLFWFRFSVDNTLGKDIEFFIKIDNPLIDVLKFYSWDGRMYRERVYGDLLPFEAREIRDRNFIIPVVQPPGTRTYYFSVASHGNLVIPVSLYSARRLLSDIGRETAPVSIFYGIMIIMLLYNLFIFISLRDSAYLYYISFILFFLLYRMAADGFGFQYLWPDGLWMQNRGTSLFIGLSTACIMLFNRSFLNLKENGPLLDRISLGFTGVILVTATVYIAAPMLRYALALFYPIITMILSMFSGVYCLVKGFRLARLYVASWSLFFLSAMIYIMRNYNIISPGPFADWSFYIAMVLLAVFFSLALADRVNIISRENERLFREVSESNEKLASEIAERIRAEQTVSLQYEEIQSQYEEMDALNTELVGSHQDLLGLNRQLAGEKERLSAMLLSIGEGVIATDEKGRVGLMNVVAEKLTGRSADSALGRPVDEVAVLVNQLSREPMASPASRAMRGGRVEERMHNVGLLSADGRELSVIISAAPMYDHDRAIIGAVLVIRDITEKQLMEKELQKARTIESIGLLAGGIAHDFNNILTTILANVSLARARIASGEEILRYIDESEKAVFRARDLTQQLLTFSKGGSPVKKLSSIHDVLKDSIGFALAGSSIRCDLSIAGDLLAAEIDEGQISQVIYNLAINAKQAMPGGGVLTVRAENSLQGEENILNLGPGRYIMISIRDRGIGIPQENLDKIFNPYFTTKKVGHGLGLASCYSIVKRHEGTITVESETGAGAEFIVYLPASEAPPSAMPEAGRTARRHSGRILVMDDEETILKVSSDILSHLGYTVDTAANGEEAVRKYWAAMEAGAGFDVVIMDLTIPGGMGGERTLEKLREIDPSVRAVVSSGYSNDPVMADYAKYGFCGVIHKPYLIKDISEMLEEVIGK